MSQDRVRVLHFADLHLDDSTLPNSLDAMWKLADLAERQRPDLIVNAGDLAMKRGSLPPWVSLELRKFHEALAAIAPVVVVEGNHDMTHDERAGTVLGALSLSAGESRGLIRCCTKPETFVVRAANGVDVVVSALPYPSRRRLLASDPTLTASSLNGRMAELLADVARGLGAEAAELVGDNVMPALLVFHGTLADAKLGDDRLMTTEMDALLPVSELPEVFGAVMCGHIHRPQMIGGRAMYAGSPAPLGFSEERYDHGAVLWTWGELPADFPARSSWLANFIPIEPKRRLYTVDWRGSDWRARLADDPAGLEDLEPNTFVRVLLELGRNEDAAEATAAFEAKAAAAGWAEVKVVIERQADELGIQHGERRADQADAIGPLLELWAARAPEAAGQLEALRTLAEELERELPAEARAAAVPASYKLESLEVDNWKSYGRGSAPLTFANLGRLVCVEGENASGKSNLMEAEAFALWGRTIRGRQTLDELVRKGQSDAKITATFEAGGERWRVTRAIRIRSNGSAAAELVLERWAERPISASMAPAGEFSLAFTEGWEPASGGTAAETQAKLEALVGSLDLYLSTRYAAQSDIDRVLSLSPAELKETLQQALATDVFGHRERAGRSALAAAERRSDKAAAELEAAKVRPAIPETGLDRKVLGEATVAAERAVNDAADALAEAIRSEERARERLTNHAARAAGFRTAHQAVADCTKAVLDLEEQKRLAAQSVENGARASEALAEAEVVRESIARLEAATQAQRDDRAKAEALRNIATAAADALAGVRRSIERGADERRRAAEAAAQAEAREAQAERQAVKAAEDRLTDAERGLSAQLESLRRRAGLVEQAPLGDKCREARCPLLADAIAAEADARNFQYVRETTVAPLEAALREAQAAQVRGGDERTKRSFDRAEREESAKAEDSERLRVATETAAGAKDEADRVAYLISNQSPEERELAEARKRLATLDTPIARSTQARAAAAAERLAAIDSEITAAAGRKAAAEAALAALGPELDHGALSQALDNAIMATSTARANENKAREAQRAADAAYQRALSWFKDCEASEAAERQAEAAATAAARAVDLLRLYLLAVGKNGLPYMILERALPALESHANAFLGSDTGGADLRVEIEPFREVLSGERRTDVVIRYRNPFGVHSLAAASGFERAALGYALRAAMAQVQAEAHGLTVSHFVADEGWGAFDESNLLLGQRMLQRMAERFGRVVFISHVGAIREVAETTIRVEGDPVNGSRIEVRS